MSLNNKKRTKKEIWKDFMENLFCLIMLAITAVVMISVNNKMNNQPEPQTPSVSVEIVRIQEE